MSEVNISGVLLDTDGQAWLNATWRAVPVSPGGNPPVFSDGSAVPVYHGQLAPDGSFSGVLGDTADIYPQGTTFQLELQSVTSAPELVIKNVRTEGGPDLDLGAKLSPVPAPRIAAAALVYAYNAAEISNPDHGCGYINTVTGSGFLWVGQQWIALGAGEAPPPEGVPEAPDDGIQYGRQSLAWTPVPVSEPPVTQSEIEKLQDRIKKLEAAFVRMKSHE